MGKVLEAVHKGPWYTPAATFGVSTFGVSTFTEKVDGSGMGLEHVFVTPLQEEVLYRLPVLLIASAVPERHALLTLSLLAVVSSLVFAYEHDPTNVNMLSYYFAGGLLFSAVARVGGITHSYGMHAGINLGILLRELGD